MRLIALLMAAGLAWAQDDAAKTESPLKALAQVGKHLDQGMGEFVKGTEAAEAFKPWTCDSKKAERIRESLKTAGIASASNLSFEFELIFVKKGTPPYCLRTLVGTSGGEARFLGFDGRSEEKLLFPGKPLDSYKGDAAPFAEAAQAVAKAIQAGQADKMPFADPENVAKMFPSEKARKEAVQRLERARKRAPEICSAVAAMGAEEVQLRIDDQAFLAQDANGTAGIIGASFEVKDDGKLAYKLREYKAFAK